MVWEADRRRQRERLLLGAGGGVAEDERAGGDGHRERVHIHSSALLARRAGARRAIPHRAATGAPEVVVATTRKRSSESSWRGGRLAARGAAVGGFDATRQQQARTSQVAAASSEPLCGDAAAEVTPQDRVDDVLNRPIAAIASGDGRLAACTHQEHAAGDRQQHVSRSAAAAEAQRRTQVRACGNSAQQQWRTTVVVMPRAHGVVHGFGRNRVRLDGRRNAASRERTRPASQRAREHVGALGAGRRATTSGRIFGVRR